MSLPEPLPGLVLRYHYLWAREAEAGAESGAKARPAAVVMTITKTAETPARVFVLPITHSQPKGAVTAIEIPEPIARAAGLDQARSWIVISEFNEFNWPGFDLDAIPGRKPRSFAYGFLPPRFFAMIRDRWLKLDAERKTIAVTRND